MNNKETFKKIMSLKVVLIINLILLGFFSLNLFREYLKNRQLNKEINKLELIASDLQAKNLDILDMVDYLDTNDFLEQEARLKLGLQKPGETSIVVNISDTEAKKLEGSADKQLDTAPNFKKWFIYFFRK